MVAAASLIVSPLDVLGDERADLAAGLEGVDDRAVLRDVAALDLGVAGDERRPHAPLALAQRVVQAREDGVAVGRHDRPVEEAVGLHESDAIIA